MEKEEKTLQLLIAYANAWDDATKGGAPLSWPAVPQKRYGYPVTGSDWQTYARALICYLNGGQLPQEPKMGGDGQWRVETDWKEVYRAVGRLATIPPYDRLFSGGALVPDDEIASLTESRKAAAKAMWMLLKK